MEYWKVHYLENSLKKYIETKNKQSSEKQTQEDNTPSVSQMQSAMNRKMAANMSNITKQLKLK